MSVMKLELANVSQSQEINDLLNMAYRGDQGWTTESSLVDGDRSITSDIKLAIKNSVFLIHKKADDVVACICLEIKGHEVFIVSFAVHPNYQTVGLGKLILHAAEQYAVNTLSATKFIMVVLSMRTELISFYERRGYQQIGINEKYPSHLNIGMPKSDGLTIEQLCKDA
jgi:ribosomal protein S18 acetylase RimI-like enzyme